MKYFNKEAIRLGVGSKLLDVFVDSARGSRAASGGVRGISSAADVTPGARRLSRSVSSPKMQARRARQQARAQSAQNLENLRATPEAVRNSQTARGIARRGRTKAEFETRRSDLQAQANRSEYLQNRNPLQKARDTIKDQFNSARANIEKFRNSQFHVGTKAVIGDLAGAKDGASSLNVAANATKKIYNAAVGNSRAAVAGAATGGAIGGVPGAIIGGGIGRVGGKVLGSAKVRKAGKYGLGIGAGAYAFNKLSDPGSPRQENY